MARQKSNKPRRRRPSGDPRKAAAARVLVPSAPAWVDPEPVPAAAPAPAPSPAPRPPSPRVLAGAARRELRRLAGEASALRRLEADAVRQAREAGLSWESIGADLGVNRETLRRRFADSVTD